MSTIKQNDINEDSPTAKTVQHTADAEGKPAASVEFSPSPADERPTKEMANAAATAAGQAPLLWLGAVVVGALVPLVCCVLARKKGDAAVWKTFGAVAVVAGVAGAICLRVAFYNMGLSVFMFY